jgi:hypothetical protein
MRGHARGVCPLGHAGGVMHLGSSTWGNARGDGVARGLRGHARRTTPRSRRRGSARRAGIDHARSGWAALVPMANLSFLNRRENMAAARGRHARSTAVSPQSGRDRSASAGTSVIVAVAAGGACGCPPRLLVGVPFPDTPDHAPGPGARTALSSDAGPRRTTNAQVF